MHSLYNNQDETFFNSDDTIPKCNIMGVMVAAINMQWLIQYLSYYLQSPYFYQISGKYVCVSNVHTIVMSYENAKYCSIQNNGLFVIPDGGPLSSLGRKKGFTNMQRTTGPDLMEALFKVSTEKKYRHFFYGSTPETLNKMIQNVSGNYPGISIAGLYSPPFGNVSPELDSQIISIINNSQADLIWVGLGAPKQEIWMAEHEGKVNGLMIGVGAGFNYFAGTIKRAPKWMQKSNLEWLYRLIQEPHRLLSRYLYTNSKFIWHAIIKGE